MTKHVNKSFSSVADTALFIDVQTQARQTILNFKTSLINFKLYSFVIQSEMYWRNFTVRGRWVQICTVVHTLPHTWHVQFVVKERLQNSGRESRVATVWQQRVDLSQHCRGHNGNRVEWVRNHVNVPARHASLHLQAFTLNFVTSCEHLQFFMCLLKQEDDLACFLMSPSICVYLIISLFMLYRFHGLKTFEFIYPHLGWSRNVVLYV